MGILKGTTFPPLTHLQRGLNAIVEDLKEERSYIYHILKGNPRSMNMNTHIEKDEIQKQGYGKSQKPSNTIDHKIVLFCMFISP